jgi:hypothetical protein
MNALLKKTVPIGAHTGARRYASHKLLIREMSVTPDTPADIE